MPLCGLDTSLVKSTHDVGLTPAQEYLLQSVVRSLNAQSHLTEHTGSTRGFATAVVRAMAVLTSHASSGQPYVRELAIPADYAAASVEEVNALVAHSELTEIASILRSRPSAELVAKSGENRPAAQAVVTALAHRLADETLREIERKLFDLAWSATPANDTEWSKLETISQHLASLIDFSGRHSEGLLLAIGASSSTQLRSADYVLGLLRSRLSVFQVVAVVDGATTLERFSSLVDEGMRPSAISLRTSAPKAADDAAAQLSEQQQFFRGPVGRLHSFVRSHRIERRSCLVSLDILAPDAFAAAATGRRSVLRVLDQYMAGDRLTDLRLGDRTLVSNPSTGRTIELTEVGRATRGAYPLIYEWPEQLSGALHAAHLLRRTETPMARAALAWVTLEASGIDNKERIASLSRALAIQCLRQELVGTYGALAKAVSVRRQILQIRRGSARADLRRARVTLRMATRADQLAKARTLAEVSAREVIRHRRLVHSHDDSCGKAMDEIARFLAVDAWGRLPDASRWLVLLLPPQHGDDEATADTRRVMRSLVEEQLPAVARVDIITWLARLADPSLCTSWLERRAVELTAFIHALKASRNQTLHAGVFALEGDRLLSDGAASLVDLTLEFLGNWYRQEGLAAGTSPVDIVTTIGKRFESVTAYLATCDVRDNRLNLGLLTSPLSTGTDRSY